METQYRDMITNQWTTVAEWSRKNFGDQSSTNPLLGIGEEIGELFNACYADDIDDALCDIVIYLMDFCARAGIDLIEAIEQAETSEYHDGHPGIVIHYGELLHGVLKNRQGIRGDQTEWIKKAVGGIFFSVVRCHMRDSRPTSPQLTVSPVASFLSTLEAVIEEVTNRDWKNAPETGVTS